MPAGNTGAITATSAAPHTATTAGSVCAKRFHRRYIYIFFFFLYYHTSAFQLLDKPWSQVSSLLPPGFLPSIFIAHRVQQSHCSSIFHRVLLTHALALSAYHYPLLANGTPLLGIKKARPGTYLLLKKNPAVTLLLHAVILPLALRLSQQEQSTTLCIFPFPSSTVQAV